MNVLVGVDEAEAKRHLKQLESRDLSDFVSDMPQLATIESWLERQDLSADAKALLMKVARTTIKVGSRIVGIGRKIFATFLSLVSKYPNTSFGLVVGAVLSFLVGSIPLVGWVIGPLLAPILLAAGVGIGAVNDFATTRIRSELDILKTQYAILQTE